MNTNVKIVEIIHQDNISNQKVGISLPTEQVKFLSELHNQYDDFLVTKSSSGDIIIITK